MENKFRNEMEVEIGGKKILLRPTFENIAAMESNIGSLAWLTWKFSRGTKFTEDGKLDRESLRSEEAIKSIPSLTDSTKIIYYNQAAHGDSAHVKYSLEEIWDLVNKTGATVAPQVVIYLGRIMAGNKAVEKEEISNDEKKS